MAAIFPERFQSFTFALKKKLLIIFSPQNRLSCLPAKMNQQEGAGAGTVSRLCAGRTMIEIKSFWKHQSEYCCGDVGGGGLASQLAWLLLFSLFCVRRIWSVGQCKAFQQNRGSYPEDEGGDGVLQQGHRGERLQELEVQDLGCL